MVTNLQTSVPSQDIGYETEQVMWARLNFDSPATINVGGLPAGGIVVGAVVQTLTAFNATSTNNINIGQTDATGTVSNAYVSAQAIGPAGTVNLTMATTTNVGLSRPTTITASYAQSGTAATAGAAVVCVRFIVP